MKPKTNKSIRIEKDSKKEFVSIYEGNELIGMLAWNYGDKRWIFFTKELLYSAMRIIEK